MLKVEKKDIHLPADKLCFARAEHKSSRSELLSTFNIQL